MGTNYYIEEKPPCKECGRHFERKHIGKSSLGWCFSLHVYPEEGINTLADWQKYWQGKTIADEYGAIIPEETLMEIITERSFAPKHRNPIGYASWNDFHNKNHSENGPNGLVRNKIDNSHCIGHGDGTWDYIIGEFC